MDGKPQSDLPAGRKPAPSVSCFDLTARPGDNSADIDRALVRRVQDGERGAFDILVTKYHHRILGLIKRRIHNPVDAPDVAQETYLKAYRAINRFRGDCAFYTWLYQIAVNACRHHTRSVTRALAHEAADRCESGDFAERDSNWHRAAVSAETPEEEASLDDAKRALCNAWDAMSDDMRLTLTLKEVFHRTYEQIGQIMCCPVGTVRSRIFRARQLLGKYSGHTFNTPAVTRRRSRLAATSRPPRAWTCQATGERSPGTLP